MKKLEIGFQHFTKWVYISNKNSGDETRVNLSELEERARQNPRALVLTQDEANTFNKISLLHGVAKTVYKELQNRLPGFDPYR